MEGSWSSGENSLGGTRATAAAISGKFFTQRAQSYGILWHNEERRHLLCMRRYIHTCARNEYRHRKTVADIKTQQKIQSIISKKEK
jgi:hypothetical protein